MTIHMDACTTNKCGCTIPRQLPFLDGVQERNHFLARHVEFAFQREPGSQASVHRIRCQSSQWGWLESQNQVSVAQLSFPVALWMSESLSMPLSIHTLGYWARRTRLWPAENPWHCQIYTRTHVRVRAKSGWRIWHRSNRSYLGCFANWKISKSQVCSSFCGWVARAMDTCARMMLTIRSY